jgi:acyl transferase domain-containing protein
MLMQRTGAQSAQMGNKLIDYKAYRQSLDVSQAVLYELGCRWLICEEIAAAKETSRVDSPEFSQPLCTALQIALVDLLRTWGIQPKSVVGHSSGEIGEWAVFIWESLLTLQSCGICSRGVDSKRSH